MSLVLVTGGAGFVGSHLCARLARDGHRVISLDNYFTGSIKNHVDGVEYREGEIGGIGWHVPEAVDLIFHLGEYARVGASFSEPETVYLFNITGTENVLRYWRRTDAKLIYAGSSTRFGDAHSPYSLTKLANAETIKATGECLGLPYAIAYLCNSYGPGERAGEYGTLIEVFRQQHGAGLPLTVKMPGTQRRNFTHVEDTVDGLALVAQNGQGDGYVLGAPESYSILDVVGMFGGSCKFEWASQGDRSDAKIDTSKSIALGWNPKHRLPDYIRECVSSKLARSA